MQRIHSRWLEGGLLGLAIIFLLITGGVTISTSLRADGSGSDLNFKGVSEELSVMLKENPDRLIKLNRSTVSAGSRKLPIDTGLITVDPAAEPGFAPGAFLNDQMRVFNDYVIRQAVGKRWPSSHREYSNDTDPPSVFRTLMNEDGAARFSEKPTVTPMIVRSPYAERSWRDVRTRDWREHTGLLGLTGEVAADSAVPDSSYAMLNRKSCLLRNDARAAYLYCSGQIGSGVKRFYDIKLESGGQVSGGALAKVSTYRRQDVWRNGSASRMSSANLSAGDVVDTRHTGTFMVSRAEFGTLAANQWINGRETFANAKLGTLSFFSGAGRDTKFGEGANPLILSLDRGISADLERRAIEFLQARRGVLSKMSVVVADLRTGEIRAIVEPHRRAQADPLLAFEPILVGSVVKPIIASAIISRRPDLVNLRIPYGGDPIDVVNGVKLAASFGNPANGCRPGEIDFSAFLSCSSNQFAAELLFRSLQADGFRGRGAASAVSRDQLEASSMGDGLAEAFDVDAQGGRNSGRNTAASAAAGMFLPWESRPWLILRDSAATRVDWLARYAFGGWENRWTMIGLSEAYARIATDRSVQASLTARKSSDTTTSKIAPAPANVRVAFAQVRKGLRQVGVDGTAAGLSERIRQSTSPEVDVLAKTGTLNETTGKLKALALAIGTPEARSDASPLKCGLVIISYFEFAKEYRVRKGESLPAVHLEFAQQHLTAALRSQWKRVSSCSQASLTTTSTADSQKSKP